MFDEIEVEYIDHMGNDLRVANVARVSFNNWKETLEDKDVKLINFLARNAHTSPFRHVMLQVRCHAPIFIARQLMKHQVGMSWNEVSRRYVKSSPTFFSPDTWRSKPEGNIKQGSGEESVEWLVDSSVSGKKTRIEESYENFLLKSQEFYNSMMESGVAPELARMVLPQSTMTSWIWTGTLQSFAHMHQLRADGHAQFEAQVFANALAPIAKERFPHCWKALYE